MRKATATYHAPEGDADTVQMGGVSFKDGESVDLNSNDHGHLVNKLGSNKHFEFNAGEDDGKDAARHPQRRDFKAGLTEAGSHDFEKDRQNEQSRRDNRSAQESPHDTSDESPVDDLDGKNVSELRALAEAKGIDHSGKSKADLRAELRS
jgi:hypothetical protein